MEITKDDLQRRIEELTKAQADALANANALGGAIQDCQFWINRLSKEEGKEEESTLKLAK